MKIFVLICFTTVFITVKAQSMLDSEIFAANALESSSKMLKISFCSIDTILVFEDTIHYNFDHQPLNRRLHIYEVQLAEVALWEYDSLKRILKSNYRVYHKINNKDFNSSNYIYHYNNKGQIIWITDDYDSSYTKKFQYHSKKQITKTFKDGKVVKKTIEKTKKKCIKSKNKSYSDSKKISISKETQILNEMGKPIEIRFKLKAFTESNAYGSTKTQTFNKYDSLGSVVSMKKYDAENNLRDSFYNKFKYDNHGNWTTMESVVHNNIYVRQAQKDKSDSKSTNCQNPERPECYDKPLRYIHLRKIKY